MQNVAMIALLVLVGLVSIYELLVSYFFFSVVVQGPSMENTLYGGEETSREQYEGGDVLFAERNFALGRGDIVVVDATSYPEFGKVIIKRIVGLAGDTLYGENGVLYRKTAGEEKFSPVDESAYVKQYENDPSYRFAFAEVTVKEGEIFVLGDNRQISKDSRYSGPLREEDVMGVVPEWAVGIKRITTPVETFRFAVSEALASFGRTISGIFS